MEIYYRDDQKGTPVSHHINAILHGGSVSMEINSYGDTYGHAMGEFVGALNKTIERLQQVAEHSAKKQREFENEQLSTSSTGAA